jgi:hypothetical protein
MSSHGLQYKDVLSSATQKPAVVVQTDEVTVQSPTAEITQLLSRTLEVGKITTITHEDDLTLFSVPVIRSRTNETAQDATIVPTPSVQRSSSHEVFWCAKKQGDVESICQSRRRLPGMQLPSFRSLGISSSDSECARESVGFTETHFGSSGKPSLTTGRAAAQSLPLPTPETTRPRQLGSTPLLTPPEDTDSIKWNNAILQYPAHPSGGESSSSIERTAQVTTATSEGQKDIPKNPTSSQVGGEDNRVLKHGEEEKREWNALQDSDDDRTSLLKAIRPFSTYCVFLIYDIANFCSCCRH